VNVKSFDRNIDERTLREAAPRLTSTITDVTQRQRALRRSQENGPARGPSFFGVVGVARIELCRFAVSPVSLFR